MEVAQELLIYPTHYFFYILDQKVNKMVEEELRKELAEIKEGIADIRKDILYAVAPKFLEISIQANDLIEFSIDFWRMVQRINKISKSLTKEQKEIIDNSLQKVKRFLDKNDIEIVDYTDQEYAEGINLEILAVEKDKSVEKTIIKETKEPTIMHKGQVVHIGKVILASNENL